jgi:hypothetical protein
MIRDVPSAGALIERIIREAAELAERLPAIARK